MIQVETGIAQRVVQETIHTRRSVRKYKQQQVPVESINDLVEAAFAAPFTIGCHALRVMVIRDQKLLAALSDSMKECSVDFLKKGRRFLRRRVPVLFPMGIVPLFNFKSVLAQFKGAMKMSQDLWWGAPTLLLMCARKEASPAYEIDVSVAIENVTLMARACGLGTCILKTTELINYYPQPRSIIGLPDDWWVIAGMSVGYPVDSEARKPAPPRPSITDPHYVQWRDQEAAPDEYILLVVSQDKVEDQSTLGGR
ncbi:MAG: nitroreductase family protein [Anaerolineae bacterium]